MLRQRIAERLVQAQHTAAILTTFNEVDMSAVMELRSKNKDAFKAKHGVELGFMSFFTRACVEAFKVVPEVNAIDRRQATSSTTTTSTSASPSAPSAASSFRFSATRTR